MPPPHLHLSLDQMASKKGQQDYFIGLPGICQAPTVCVFWSNDITQCGHPFTEDVPLAAAKHPCLWGLMAHSKGMHPTPEDAKS